MHACMVGMGTCQADETVSSLKLRLNKAPVLSPRGQGWRVTRSDEAESSTVLLRSASSSRRGRRPGYSSGAIAIPLGVCTARLAWCGRSSCGSDGSDTPRERPRGPTNSYRGSQGMSARRPSPPGYVNIPCSSAYRVSSAVVRTPSSSMMQDLWNSTVFTEMPMMLAISFAPLPSATS